MKAKWNTTGISKMVDDAVERGVTALANDIVKNAQERMREPGEGVDYSPKSKDPEAQWMPKEWRKQFRNRSSSPGQAPAVQKGGLIRSVQFKAVKRFTRHVGTNLAYGGYLELGTRKIKPRPWLRPAYKAITGRDIDVEFKGKLP